MAKILVAEDDDLLARLIERTLTRMDYEVVCAADGKQALKLYENGEFDLVVTDLIMPEKEGLELISALRKINANVKIIAMSGGGRTGPSSYLPIAKHMGAKAVLRKPFTIELLMQTVQEVLDDSGKG